jgi:hypothetical protein
MRPRKQKRMCRLTHLAKTLGVRQPPDLLSREERHDELLARVVEAICQRHERKTDKISSSMTR